MDNTKNHKWQHLRSLLRNGDFNHVGAEEAISLVMQKLSPEGENAQFLLDAGCGLGGTANFIKTTGWGKVIGIDKNAESIEYAKAHYHGIDFHVCDLIKVDELFTIALFEVVCLFNIYASLHNPRQSLHALHKITKQHGKIAIFDYLDLSENQLNPLFQEGCSKTNPFRPIKMDEIEPLLQINNWEIDEIINLNDKYRDYAISLLRRLLHHLAILRA